MKKLKNLKKLCGVPVLLLILTLSPVFSEGQKVPEEVKALVGTYSGSWIIYGIDANGNIVEKMKWTDTMEAKNPTVKEGRAFVETVDKMKFPGSNNFTEMKGIEGYFLNKDGSLGDYFYETFGQVYKMIKLGKKTWAYTIPAFPNRLSFLGFNNVISGRHVMVKEVVEEDGMETHRVSRITTVNWKDNNGKIKWKQFISLQGHHKRTKK